MKQIFIACIFLYAGCQNVLAQHSFGIKAGVNRATQRIRVDESFIPSTYFVDKKSLTGYQLGAFFKTSFGKGWALSIEPAFSQIGSQNYYLLESNLNDPSKEYSKDKISYIELPVTFQYSLKSFYLGAGPGIAIKVGSRYSDFEDRSFKTNFYKTLDANANFLIGYTFCNKLDANLRYSHGLLNVRKSDSFIDTRNQFWNFSLLYSICP